MASTSGYKDSQGQEINENPAPALAVNNPFNILSLAEEEGADTRIVQAKEPSNKQQQQAVVDTPISEQPVEFLDISQQASPPVNLDKQADTLDNQADIADYVDMEIHKIQVPEEEDQTLTHSNDAEKIETEGESFPHSNEDNEDNEPAQITPLAMIHVKESHSCANASGQEPFLLTNGESDHEVEEDDILERTEIETCSDSEVHKKAKQVTFSMSTRSKTNPHGSSKKKSCQCYNP
ncbi:hypothetical protein FRX31_018036 [Thalictrum thalictroides]|uniref:Uncharacterized protein n=1 Tax=Thalictrum thalictroides TaxID=46969 RepID=A0A7J6W626_THATH|nr:hypothetical protein FRX31_018036 [Thalictrum thalictroides]